jgi:hypothetical protein
MTGDVNEPKKPGARSAQGVLWQKHTRKKIGVSLVLNIFESSEMEKAVVRA